MQLLQEELILLEATHWVAGKVILRGWHLCFWDSNCINRRESWLAGQDNSLVWEQLAIVVL